MKAALAAVLSITVTGCDAPKPVEPPNVDLNAWQSTDRVAEPQPDLLKRYVGCYWFGPSASLPEPLHERFFVVRLQSAQLPSLGRMRMTVTPRTPAYRTSWSIYGRVAHLDWVQVDSGFQVILDNRGVEPRATTAILAGPDSLPSREPLKLQRVPCQTVD
jgi:hypothetical protein